MEKTNEYYNERIDFILSEKSRIKRKCDERIQELYKDKALRNFEMQKKILSIRSFPWNRRKARIRKAELELECTQLMLMYKHQIQDTHHEADIRLVGLDNELRTLKRERAERLYKDAQERKERNRMENGAQVQEEGKVNGAEHC